MKKSENSKLTISEQIQDIGMKWAPALKTTILLLISIGAILVRVFSVTKH